MYLLHFSNTSWIIEGNTLNQIHITNSVTLEAIMGYSGGICVALFAFITGYGMYHSLTKSSEWKRCINKIGSIYLDFWIVMIPLIVLFFCLGNTITLVDFLLSLLSIDNKLNVFCWYVHFYAIALVLLFIYHKYIAPHKRISCIFVLVSLVLSLMTISTQTLYGQRGVYYPVILVGYNIAKYKVYDNLYVRINKIIPNRLVLRVLGFFGITGVVFGKFALAAVSGWKITVQIEWLLATVLIFAIILLFYQDSEEEIKYNNIACLLACLLGSLSTNMWYLHAIFFGAYAKLQFIAYIPNYLGVIVIWVYIILLPIAFVLHRVQQKLVKRR